MILDSACSEKTFLAKRTRELSFPFNRGLRRTGRSIELDVLRNECKHTTKKRVKCMHPPSSSCWKESVTAITAFQKEKGKMPHSHAFPQPNDEMRLMAIGTRMVFLEILTVKSS